MKNTLIAFTLALASASTMAAGTDFQTDSLHKGIHGTPFQQGQDIPLPSAFAAQLKTLLSNCVVELQGRTHGSPADFGPKVLPQCAGLIQTRYDQRAVSDLARINVGGVWIVGKTFDGLDSDGGDEFDIAVYDAQGTRRALATSNYTETSALAGLARLAGLKKFTSISRQAYDTLPRF